MNLQRQRKNSILKLEKQIWGQRQFPSQSMCFCLFHQKVGDDKLPEDGDVPEVDKEQAEVAGEEECQEKGVKVEEGLVVHPGNDDHPDCKGGQVDPCVQLELVGGPIDAGNGVDDPSLVEHRVHLSHQAEVQKIQLIANKLLWTLCSKQHLCKHVDILCHTLWICYVKFC